MTTRFGDRTIVGFCEELTMEGVNGSERHTARIDTGATKSSIDIILASRLKLGPIIHSKAVKSAHGTRIRPIVEAEFEIGGRRIKAEFTLADRGHMKYKVLIGQNVLRQGFLIDPQKR
ncbi:MAG: RimK/LysX family protein [Nanoarchaeota archaeon]